MSMEGKKKHLIHRDGRWCRYCGISLLSAREHPQFMTIDHVIPKKHKGSSEYSNLVLACRLCNTLKGDLLLNELDWCLLNPGTWNTPYLADLLRNDLARRKKVFVQRRREQRMSERSYSGADTPGPTITQAPEPERDTRVVLSPGWSDIDISRPFVVAHQSGRTEMVMPGGTVTVVDHGIVLQEVVNQLKHLFDETPLEAFRFGTERTAMLMSMDAVHQVIDYITNETGIG